MRVLVTGDLKHPVLLDTTEATALLIFDNNNKPCTIYRMLDNNDGFVRYQTGEDKNFNEVAKELGLL